MRHLPLIAALALTPTASHAKCDLTVRDMREHLTDDTTMTEVSPKVFYFLEGIWAMDSATPEGLPANAGRAFILHKAGRDRRDIVFFTDGDDGGCLVPPVMPARPALIDLIDQVDKGPGAPL